MATAKKISDKERLDWLHKQGRKETSYRWNWVSAKTRANNRIRIDAAIRAERKPKEGKP